MAINGWYISRIITDIQEGKVDEFLNKEGKWYNYIKGEDTTHTNAADNLGTFTGNLDVNEFSVQGIGKLSIDATVASGTTPQSGGNVTVTFSGGNNWTSTGFAIQNTANFPSTGSFTIEPLPGFGISANDFTNALTQVTLPSHISSITFTDTTTAGLHNNDVTGTITFDTTSSTATSFTAGSVVSNNIVLSITAQQALVLYKANLVINGVFHTSNGVQDELTCHANYTTYNLISSTNLKRVYEIEKYVIPNVATKVVDYSYTPGPNIITAGNPYINYDIQPGELALYQENIQAPGFQFSSYNNTIPSNAYVVQAEYTATGLATVDEDNEITINLNSAEGVCFFNTTQNPYALPDNGGIVTIPVQNNLGAFNVSFSGGIAASGVIVSSNTSITNSGNSFVTLDLAENTSGSNITGVINLFSNSNTTTTPNDSINVEQGLASTVNVTGALQAVYTDVNGQQSTQWTYDYPPTNSIAGYYNALDGSSSNPKLDAAASQIIINAEVGNFLFVGSSTYGDNFTIVYSDPNNAGWLGSTTSSFFGAPTGGQSQYSFSVQKILSVDQNPAGGAERSATITYPHPNDPTLTDSITITQEAGYDSTTNTLAFSNTTNSSPYAYADNVDITIDHNAQTLEIYANIPNVDVASDNPFTSDAQNIVLNANFPAPYHSNNNNFLDDSVDHQIINNNANNSTGLSSAVGPKWWLFSAEPNTPNIVNTSTGAITPAHQITHKITINVDQNYNTDGIDNDFPIDRNFILLGYNPENKELLNSDDQIKIIQTAQPCARWNTGPSIYNNTNGNPHAVNEFTVPSTYNASDGVDIVFKANGSTPNVSCFASFDNPSSTWISPSVNGNINSITVTATNNENEYNAHIDLAENFSGNENKFTLGAYHSSVSNSSTENPINHGIKADPITIIQDAAVNLLEVSTFTLPTGVMLSSTGAIASTVGSISYSAHQYVVTDSSFTGDITIPINYNGSTPVVANEQNQTGSSSFASGTASWLGSAPAVNASNDLIVNYSSANSSGSNRVIEFDLQHGNNASAFMSFTIIQLG